MRFTFDQRKIAVIFPHGPADPEGFQGQPDVFHPDGSLFGGDGLTVSAKFIAQQPDVMILRPICSQLDASADLIVIPAFIPIIR